MLPNLPETPFSRAIDRALEIVGRTASWLWLILMIVIVTNVGLRHMFGQGRVELEELQWHLNSVAFLIAIAYAYKMDAHIRIDLVSTGMRERTQAWIELYGTLLLLIPFVVMVLVFSLPFVEHSWTTGEISQSPGGLPLRWLLKAVLPAAFVMLSFAIAARLHRLWRFLTTEQAANSTNPVTEQSS